MPKRNKTHLIINNFFTEPDKIVELSNNYQYTRDIHGNWPGERTDCISNLNKNLFNYIGNKIHNIFISTFQIWVPFFIWINNRLPN